MEPPREVHGSCYAEPKVNISLRDHTAEAFPGVTHGGGIGNRPIHLS